MNSWNTLTEKEISNMLSNDALPKAKVLKNNIKFIKKTEKLVEAKITDARIYTVELWDVSDEMYSVCSCGKTDANNKCCHVGAVLLNLVEQTNLSEFDTSNKKIKNTSNPIKTSIHNELTKLGLTKEQIEIFYLFVKKSEWQKAIKIHKNINIIKIRDNKTDFIKILINTESKDFAVELSLCDIEMYGKCSCFSYGKSRDCCAHIGAVFLYKLLEKNRNEFNSRLELCKIWGGKCIKRKESDLDYFKQLTSIDEKNKKEHLIFFNFENFSVDYNHLNLQKAMIKKDKTLGAFSDIQLNKLKNYNLKISQKMKHALSFIENKSDEYGYYSNDYAKSNFNDINTDLLMPALKEIYFNEQDKILGAVFSENKFNIIFEIKKNKNNYSLIPFFILGDEKKKIAEMKLSNLGKNSLWIFDENKRCFSEYGGAGDRNIVKNIIKHFKKMNLDEFELKEFFSKYYPKMLNDFEFNISDKLKREEKDIIPKPKIYLEKNSQDINLKLKFNYLENEIDFFSLNENFIFVENDVIYDVLRHTQKESEVLEILKNNNIIHCENEQCFKIHGDLIDFITHDISNIAKQGIEIFGEENLFDFKIVKDRPKLNLSLSKEMDWFNIKGKASFGEDDIEFDKILKSISQNKRFVELSSGKMAVIPKQWINNLKAFSNFAESKENYAKLSSHHVSLVDSIIELSENVDMDKETKRVISSFKKFEKIENYNLPKDINATLRKYQKHGFDWLCFLREFEFNGILADDMGLGKTLQALAFLKKLKEDKSKNPFLVVVPTSLVFNWKNEIKKFVPDLKVCIHYGDKRIKANDKNNLNKFKKHLNTADIVLTTYGILRNDLELFTNINFDYIVLDEAHVIKNPLSQSAKSVCALNGKNKLIISGTPIQNNLTELWSLFHFLNPGYLGKYDFFRETFVIPIEKYEDKVVADSLRKMINPFVLKRTKEVIAKELPKKTEIVLKSSFNKEEQEVYDNWTKYYRHEIKETIKKEGINKARFKILEGLTKLRQICLHPKMIDTRYKGKSAKFDLLMSQIKEVINEGHKVLVFSSYVKMLTIIKDEFKIQGINYSYLDGKTKKREKEVSEFQENHEKQVFLISIKAGGLGLNLTAADYVFIVDPWWNPAVEMQAMDRAHRIGQDKQVFVYKMIAENTIEEKILKLQESKKKLVKEIISEEKGFLKSINVEDINGLFT